MIIVTEQEFAQYKTSSRVKIKNRLERLLQELKEQHNGEIIKLSASEDLGVDYVGYNVIYNLRKKGYEIAVVSRDTWKVKEFAVKLQ